LSTQHVITDIDSFTTCMSLTAVEVVGGSVGLRVMGAMETVGFGVMVGVTVGTGDTVGALEIVGMLEI
jgi:hypothetical protein